MNKNTIQSRVKFFIGIDKKIKTSAPSTLSRRGNNFIDKEEVVNQDIENDFFEFEKELSDLKASNKTVSNIDVDYSLDDKK